MDRRAILLTACLALGIALPNAKSADSSPQLKIFPSALELRGKEDRKGFIVQSVDAQGVTKDVTASAKIRLADAAIAAINGNGLSPLKNGKTRLLVELGDLKSEATVDVAD